MVSGLYLYSQLELVLVWGCLLMFQTHGEDVAFMKRTQKECWDNKIQKNLCSGLSLASSMSQLMGIPFLLRCSARLSFLSRLQHSTSGSLLCPTSVSSNLPMHWTALCQEISWVSYIWMERNGSSGLSPRFLMWREMLWHLLGQRAFGGSGLQVCCLPSNCLSESQQKLSMGYWVVPKSPSESACAY